MAIFKYMVDGKEVPFESIAHAEVKKQFENLQAAFAKQLGSSQCPEHNREPVIMFFCKNGELAGMGYSTCCKEYADTLQPLMKVTVSGLDLTKWEATTRIMKYTEMG